MFSSLGLTLLNVPLFSITEIGIKKYLAFSSFDYLFTEKAAVYLVNCSRSPTVCKHQHVQGFPSVKLFRSVAWSQFGSCATDHIQQKYIALDYHRPLEVLDP
jgi:hypothetical protein